MARITKLLLKNVFTKGVRNEKFSTAVTVIVLVAFENAPEAPLAGAVKVTLAPGTTLLNWSRTVAVIVVPKAVLTVVLCGVPEVALMLFGRSAVLVSEKLAGVTTPVTAAVTL